LPLAAKSPTKKIKRGERMLPSFFFHVKAPAQVAAAAGTSKREKRSFSLFLCLTGPVVFFFALECSSAAPFGDTDSANRRRQDFLFGEQFSGGESELLALELDQPRAREALVKTFTRGERMLPSFFVPTVFLHRDRRKNRNEVGQKRSAREQ
jgi:hypothetical protein